MNVKGTLVWHRKNLIVKKFGADRWIQFMQELAKKDEFFNRTILFVTPIPVEKFLFFMDELVKTFYNNDPDKYFEIGEDSAKWFLNKGIYSFLFNNKNKSLIKDKIASLFKQYYSAGNFKFDYSNDILDLHISNVPIHKYFESLLVGHVKAILELAGFKVKNIQRIKGFSNGDSEVHYKFFT